MRAWTRGLVILLAMAEGVIGLWITLAPMSFYEDGPVPGTGWVKLLPPYNEHLLRDYGGMTLAITFILVVTAVKMTPFLVRVSMIALLLFVVPHTIFHIVHLEHFTRSDAIAQTTTLVLTLLVPIVLIAMAGRLPKTKV
jgi:hypothetical protein